MRKIGLVFLSGFAWTSAAGAEDATLSYTTFGTPGLIDMPTAQSAPDAELAMTGSYLGKTQRYTLSFQILPRLSGSFRYSRIDDYTGPGEDTFDRSFDLRLRVLDEGYYRPAMAIGFQDFIGTGIYSGEYVAATKHITPRLSFTGGVGWGRFGSYKGITNPLGVLDNRFKRRATSISDLGGKFESKRWFRGDMGVFGGVAWAATDRLILKAEYSSDAYDIETGIGNFDHKTPLNFGADFKISNGINLQGYYLYGDQLGATLTFTMNPKNPPESGYRNSGPVPVKPRDPAKLHDMDWVENPKRRLKLRERLAKVLKADGMILEAVDFDARIVTIWLRNKNYLIEAEMIGRAARAMTQVMPDSVSTFRIVPVASGIAAVAVTLDRGDLEVLENDPDGAWKIYNRARIGDYPYHVDRDSLNPDVYPKFTWSVGPDATFSYFDPDNPLRYEVLAKADAEYNILPGLYLNGSVTQPLFGTKDDVKRPPASVLPHVRTDVGRYDRANGPRLGSLTAAYFFRPGENLYGRVTGGYLERMFGGLSGEVLWKPVNRRYALGAEMNYVWQRDFNQRFGFREYNVATGHVSGYYQLGNGFHTQLDLGRYLAKDWGGTLTIDREFLNGWKVGVYATKTDVSSADFGEGSFDKGLRLTIPLASILGTPTRRAYNTVIQPLTRDGGARLQVPGRLYNKVRRYHRHSLKDGRGRFWR